MSILSKPIGSITVADLDALIEARARETNELEFKGALPFKPTKGQPETADRWIEKGDYVGDHARDRLLAEMIAFANAEGGTLILGLHEAGQQDGPKVADRLVALPRCEALLKRLLDAAEDAVEPRLIGLDGQAVPETANGLDGFVVLRVGKSIRGPHRLKGDREFYIRRSDRAVRMDVREIKDLTLDLARSGDRLAASFAERQLLSNARWLRTDNAYIGGNKGPYLIRVSALPTVQWQIAELTKRRDFWWLGSSFHISLSGSENKSSYPSDVFNGNPKPRLRSFEMLPDDGDPEVLYRTLRADGLVEFTLAHAGYKDEQYPTFATDIRFSAVAQLVVGVLCQVEHLRRKTGQGSISYALEIEIRSREGSRIFRDGERQTSAFGKNNQPGSVIMPRLEIFGFDDGDAVLSLMLLDISNAWGQHWDLPVTAPWGKLLPG